jgi:hypothetical protein
LLLDIRTVDLKYVRFRDMKQMEHDKLHELIGMIEHILSPTIPRANLSLHHEPAPTLTMKANELTLHTNNVLPVHHDQPPQTKPTVTKLVNQDISSKSGSILRYIFSGC